MSAFPPTAVLGVVETFLDLALPDTPVARVIDPVTATRPAGVAMGLVAHVTVSEDSEDDLEITQHPVEQGAQISDHSFKRPSVVRVRLGWTNSGAWRPLWGNIPILDMKQFVDVRAVYEQILYLQAQRFPFTVYTGKRIYNNMLVQSIRSTTDEKTETSFLCDITFRQIELVNTQLVSGAAQFAAVASPNRGQLSTPGQNQPSTPAGQVPTKPTSYNNARDIPGVAL